MTPDDWLRLLSQHPVIAVIRVGDRPLGEHMAHVAAAAGIRLIEITWNSADAARSICTLRRELPDCFIGTGTVLDGSMLEGAIAAGAQFVFSPHTDAELIRTAIQQQVPMIPGALTPTEIITAWNAGAYSVKVFPVSTLGGASYIRSLQGPLGHIPLIPTGGMTVQSAKDCLDAGAIAVGISSHLFPKSLIDTNRWDIITERAASLVTALTHRETPHPCPPVRTELNSAERDKHHLNV
ncbi:MAG: bifunctional 4-hydroxy-2-oxoglutarate aldolase/2-dehydro-3-deoxy-phosphogluconate aldolase [Leptolyngbyaceae bacterium]|nr:bifunctional 4-hydroxy-2-oxoglutarate aldolase/2-dehydro-3-deoxy-phosphogluconate aldolase [Leptolyngbyaceae bacterium]